MNKIDDKKINMKLFGTNHNMKIAHYNQSIKSCFLVGNNLLVGSIQH